MRRPIYKKIIHFIPLAIVAFLVISYFFGLQFEKKDSIKIAENSQNPGIVSEEPNFFPDNNIRVSNMGENPETQKISENDQTSLISVSLKVQEKVYQTEIPEGFSAYELMQKLRNNGLQFSGFEYSGLGFYVSEINDVKEDKKTGSYWTLYINDNESNVGVSTLIPKSGDIIEWKYETRN